MSDYERVPYSKEDWERDMAYFRERRRCEDEMNGKWLTEIEERSKPMYDTPYLRYLNRQPIEIQPFRLQPFRAEGTPSACVLPRLTAVEAHEAINRILSDVNYSMSLRRVVREERAKKRTRRQHRGAFRRRKRGLA